MELARVTEAAAMAAARHMGKGNKEGADQAAVDAMRYVLGSVDMDGVVVIGEGEKDEAPMLYIGEEIGNGQPPRTDIAVDPIDGTTLLSKGMPNAVSVVALSERGAMLRVPHEIVYMEKLAVGPDAAGAIDLNAPLSENIRRVARAKGKQIGETTIVMLERDRHADILKEIRETGARLKLISDGDVAGAIMAGLDDFSGIDILAGIGGAPEAIIAAAALKCIGGNIQTRFWPRNDGEKAAAEAAGFDIARVYGIDDLIAGEDVFFAATGITDGEILKGVRYTRTGAQTETLIMRCRSGTIRRLESKHNFGKLQKLSEVSFSERPL
jgi:fructose-1,6-bisphosphatase II